MSEVLFESSRLALESDVNSILSIWNEHKYAIEDKRGGSMLLQLQSSKLDETLKDKISSFDHLVIVGLFDGVVFGFAIVEYSSLSGSDILATLTHFIVDSEARKVAVGESMMNLVVSLAKERGAKVIDSQALPGDRETKNFFESFGMKARLLTVSKQLD